MTTILLLLAACDPTKTGASPCQQYCDTLAQVYPQAVEASGADTTDLAGYEDGEFDEDAYAAACADAPTDADCETCSEWYSATFLAPLGANDSCDATYGRSDELEGAEEECHELCDGAGLPH